MFEFLGKHPVERAHFDSWMVERRRGKLEWLDIFPFKERLSNNLRNDQDAVVLVDVGGSQGRELVKFRERYPDIPGKLVLQDLPGPLNGIKSPLEGIEVMSHDFYTPQPVKGQRLPIKKLQLLKCESSRCSSLFFPWCMS